MLVPLGLLEWRGFRNFLLQRNKKILTLRGDIPHIGYVAVHKSRTTIRTAEPGVRHPPGPGDQTAEKAKETRYDHHEENRDFHLRRQRSFGR